tara:strand:- start:1379 stop:1495 length:117 start_codon:yes stop_codon:yes gene_type:complete
MSGWEKEMLMNATAMKSRIYFRIKKFPYPEIGEFSKKF